MPNRAAVVLLAACVAGCGPSGGLERRGLSGTVTYQGSPVPSGVVRVQPDRAKGNRGPQGTAVITDGRYEIGSEKGIVSGPLVVVVQGGNGVNANPERPYGAPLFEPHTLAIDSPDGQRLDIEVP